MYYSGWFVPFPAAFAATAASNGAVPLVQMDPDGISVAGIAAGRYDGYLSAYAEAVRAYRHPVIVSFGHEMNGSWSSWGYRHTSPATFVAAWRHIVTLFRELGAGNVTWLWTVNIINNTQQGTIPPPAPWWPGSSYVTWVGIDGYYLKPDWQFAPLFGPTIASIRALTRGPDPRRRDRRDAHLGPARQDRRHVRRHSRLRPARVRLVRFHELRRPGLHRQQSRGGGRVPHRRQRVHQARIVTGSRDVRDLRARSTAQQDAREPMVLPDPEQAGAAGPHLTGVRPLPAGAGRCRR